MTSVNAVLLGLVQAAGEFLPISSSAHLVLMPWLLGMEYQGLTYDIFLHLATLIAVLIYFRKEWFTIIKDGLTKPKTEEGKILWLLVLGTIPAAICGVLFEDWIETVFRSPFVIAAALIVFAVILHLADKRAGQKDVALNVKTVLIIGCAQALALMPGVSRSGITITAALFLGFSRAESAKISFLLSTPIIAGAAVLKLKDINPADINAAFIAGFLTAAIFGWLFIKFLMNYVQKHNFNIFVVYRIALGVIIIITALMK
ncbi:Undecaprenyl-diphosphatase [Elusimicrobium minutum Pei191]|uniref:Undecaprenyl-diphosphatase n=1 Tax=Elusimicrobium minutum (strain Pei191) TaxID=445932 RepID=UPPP_ELUMP|nr:undecaprenyl-diphosphate phosphatase [Elusimicrobium minutum]B2KE93.1 RecName: Full=Undecaprenyl-diphosphatase; AltName: Full=Bacitracin resistance protein; AltName: Full=Undecaprenyl pyrophosphate phosphatase [Elusimicrobium minutum Pei191]ACC98839.1 Undecaprenyl-diphosphatase [Elusimicrobium minutum Pei191]